MKKYEVKPFVEVHQKEIITKISFLTRLSIKAIGNDLCNHAVNSDIAIQLAPYFKRNIKIKNKEFSAQPNPLTLPKNHDKELERISLMLDEPIYEYAYSLYYATGITVPKITAMMIDYSMNDVDFFNSYVGSFVSTKVSPERKNLMMSILNEINGKFEDEYSMADLLFYISDEVKEFDGSIVSGIEEVVSRWTVS